MFSQARAQALKVIMKTNHINYIICHLHTLAAQRPPQRSPLDKRNTSSSMNL